MIDKHIQKLINKQRRMMKKNSDKLTETDLGAMKII